MQPLLQEDTTTGLHQTPWFRGNVGGTVQQAKNRLTQSVLTRASPTLRG